jgi:DNA-binding Xre family transcriptional regulator
MPISYEPLFHTLIKKGLKKTDLKKLAGLSSAAVAKFAKNEAVSLEIVEKLCKALDCQPGDIYEITKEGQDE